ncbi:MAG TPA: hypothetical protein VF260_13315 [Bacilli bacterium]
MMKYLYFVLFVGAFVFGVIVLAINAPNGKEKAAEQRDDQLLVIATNFQFDKPEYVVKKGQTLTVTLDSQIGLHGLEIDGYDVKLDSNNNEKKVTFDKAGTFDMRCAVLCGTGHADMKAKLIVQE